MSGRDELLFRAMAEHFILSKCLERVALEQIRLNRVIDEAADEPELQNDVAHYQEQLINRGVAGSILQGLAKELQHIIGDFLAPPSPTRRDIAISKLRRLPFTNDGRVPELFVEDYERHVQSATAVAIAGDDDGAMEVDDEVEDVLATMDSIEISDDGSSNRLDAKIVIDPQEVKTHFGQLWELLMPASSLTN